MSQQNQGMNAVWIERDPQMGHAVRFCWRSGAGQFNSTCYRRNQVAALERDHGQLDAESRAIMEAVIPPLRHKDGDVWIERDQHMSGAVRFCWQEHGDEFNSTCYRRNQVAALERDHGQLDAESRAIMEAVIPPLRHKDGDVWIERDQHMNGAVRFCWQAHGDEFNTSCNRRNQVAAMEQRCGKKLDPDYQRMVEAVIAPPPHQDGDAWLETRYAMPDDVIFCCQHNGDVFSRTYYSRADLEAAVRSHGKPLVAGTELMLK